MIQLTVSCLCGQSRQTLTSRSHPESGLALCHCDTCRHTTGQLVTSYLPVEEPDYRDGLVQYTHADRNSSDQRWFCGTCGCHLFRRHPGPNEADPAEWEVATGTIVAEDAQAEDQEPGDAGFKRHINVRDTVDGGLATFLQDGITGASTPEPSFPGTRNIRAAQAPTPDDGDDDILHAACACGRVRFHITRPDGSSLAPRSNFPDLLLPYHTRDTNITNPTDEKWWLRPPPPTAITDNSPPTKATALADPTASGRPGGRYLAGTCACRSCRLASGFEVQSWGFVPASNIVFARPGQHAAPSSGPHPQPVDFSLLNEAGVLRGHGSSAGVVREFCGGCGATVFWHDAVRPLLIDVSLGVLGAGGPGRGPRGRRAGARAEAWFDWHRGRVSFVEEVARGREAAPRSVRRARDLILALETGLRGEKGEGGG